MNSLNMDKRSGYCKVCGVCKTKINEHRRKKHPCGFCENGSISNCYGCDIGICSGCQLPEGPFCSDCAIWENTVNTRKKTSPDLKHRFVYFNISSEQSACPALDKT